MGIARTCCLATNVRRVLLHLHSRQIILMRRGQLEVRLASGSASVRQSQLFWSAATCRRYGPGVSRKAATSRRTPYRTRHLSVFCAHPVAETPSWRKPLVAEGSLEKI